jgi:tetraspanin-13/31
MLFFYMVVLFLIFLIQFSVSCAALAINEDDERKIVEQSWNVAYKNSNESSLILQAEQTFHCCGLKPDPKNETLIYQEVLCEQVKDLDGKFCKNKDGTYGSCDTCMNKIKDKVNTGFNGAGVVGLIFSFTELIGGIVACRYRNQLDPFAQTPSTPFGSG